MRHLFTKTIPFQLCYKLLLFCTLQQCIGKEDICAPANVFNSGSSLRDCLKSGACNKWLVFVAVYPIFVFNCLVCTNQAVRFLCRIIYLFCLLSSIVSALCWRITTTYNCLLSYCFNLVSGREFSLAVITHSLNWCFTIEKSTW